MSVPTVAIGDFIYRAQFFVRTKHEHLLEFVLADTERRNNPAKSYGQLLWDMFDREFEQDQAISVVHYGAQGDVCFTVEAPTIPELQQALLRCDDVVQRWINKYRVNAMKDTS